MKFQINSKLMALLPLLLLLGGWQWVGSLSPRLFFLYSTPTSVISTLVFEFCRPEFWGDIAVTSAEVTGGLILGNFLGTGFALLLWQYPRVREVFHPYVIAVSSIPIFAVMPLFILWFGVGFLAKLAIIIFSTAFVALAYSLAVAISVGKEYEEMVASFGGTRTDLLRKVVIPGVIARSFVAYKMNVSFALIGAYIAEWVSAERGIAQFILRATNLYDIPRVWAGLTVFLMMAFVLFGVTNALERKVVPSKKLFL